MFSDFAGRLKFFYRCIDAIEFIVADLQDSE